MISALWFLIYSLAVYRLAELISKDLVFDRIRRWVVKRAAAGGATWNMVADWIHCPLCIGVWFALPAALLYCSVILHLTNAVYVIPTWLGIAGLQYFLSSRDLDRDFD